MTDTDHERWSEDLAAYMLGALEPGAAKELERHAESCEQCREQIGWLAPAVHVLPESVERLEPPPDLRSRILAEARADANGGGRLSGWLRGFGSMPLALRPATALAAVVLIAVAIGGFAIGTGDLGDGEPATGTVAVGQPPDTTAKVIREGDKATLLLTHVDELPENRVLEAWVRRDGEVEPVPKLFVPDGDGTASTRIDDMRGVDLVMVTTEPAGGSESPTSAPIVKVPIPN